MNIKNLNHLLPCAVEFNIPQNPGPSTFSEAQPHWSSTSATAQHYKPQDLGSFTLYLHVAAQLHESQDRGPSWLILRMSLNSVSSSRVLKGDFDDGAVQNYIKVWWLAGQLGKKSTLVSIMHYFQKWCGTRVEKKRCHAQLDSTKIQSTIFCLSIVCLSWSIFHPTTH